jgi:hypothetical protein
MSTCARDVAMHDSCKASVVAGRVPETPVGPASPCFALISIHCAASVDASLARVDEPARRALRTDSRDWGGIRKRLGMILVWPVRQRKKARRQSGRRDPLWKRFAKRAMGEAAATRASVVRPPNP